MEVEPKKVISYKLPNGKCPFVEWLKSLDPKARTKINRAVDKIGENLLTKKNSEAVGLGVYEFKIFSGPGYRIYFGQTSLTIILLWGGDKSTQSRDILKAKEYWADYEQRKSSNQ